ncbi:MAG: Tex-like N-terminal domain-containing protein [Promethearchaeota archaeon]
MVTTEPIDIPTEINPKEINKRIADTRKIDLMIILKTVELLQSGNTVPFVARYRKEVTKGLDETQIRAIQKDLNKFISLDERKIVILNIIQKQGKLTEAIKSKILKAGTLQDVEDLYLPYKVKLKTLGAKAREKGLEPLSILITSGQKEGTIEEIAKKFLNPEKDVNIIDEAISGAIDIIAEDVGTNPDHRKMVRNVVFKRSVLKSELNKKILDGSLTPQTKEGKHIDHNIFEIYFDFPLETTRLKNHQILALNRGEKFKILNLTFQTPDEDLIHELKKQIMKKQTKQDNIFFDYYQKAIESGYKRYIIRAIKRELWNKLVDEAEIHAIKVFATNLKNLLMTAPMKHKAIIGIDPGYRTGCKVAVIDQYGKFLENATIFPHEPKNQIGQSKKILFNLAKSHNAHTFAIGNGTASRETEQLVVQIIKDHGSKSIPLNYAMVSEDGASVYSASKVAIEEFPDLDLTVRGAISIARRLQDPLSELIKIDPKSMGVGMYQHDVNQRELKSELDAVIEDCVNSVGVDLNTASVSLLEKNGAFTSRDQLKEVRSLGPKAFEQCAGFLKIPNATNPLDGTFVHPESYDLTEKIMGELGLKPVDLINSNPDIRNKAAETLLKVRPKSFAAKFEVDANKIRYLVEQLRKPDLDPRDDSDGPVLRQDVLSIDHLKEGMILKGTIRNVVDFGAFVDIGVKINGLVHKSQIANQYVKNPQDFLSVGEVKDFMIFKVDKERKRIQLSLKLIPQEK